MARGGASLTGARHLGGPARWLGLVILATKAIATMNMIHNALYRPVQAGTSPAYTSGYMKSRTVFGISSATLQANAGPQPGARGNGLNRCSICSFG
jgi:hypothetical protein